MKIRISFAGITGDTTLGKAKAKLLCNAELLDTPLPGLSQVGFKVVMVAGESAPTVWAQFAGLRQDPEAALDIAQMSLEGIHQAIRDAYVLAKRANVVQSVHDIAC